MERPSPLLTCTITTTRVSAYNWEVETNWIDARFARLASERGDRVSALLDVVYPKAEAVIVVVARV